jgi:hypothetical protein
MSTLPTIYPGLTIRVYTKKRGDQPDLSDPICLRPGATIETVCHGIHRSLASHFKFVLFLFLWVARGWWTGMRWYGVNRVNSARNLRRSGWRIWFMMRMCKYTEPCISTGTDEDVVSVYSQSRRLQVRGRRIEEMFLHNYAILRLTTINNYNKYSNLH